MKLKIHLIFASLLLVSASMSFSSCIGEDWEADYDLVLTDASHGSLTNGQVVATGDAINVTSNSATILFSANYNYKERLDINNPVILYTSSDPNVSNFKWEYTYTGTYYHKPLYITIGDFTQSECVVTLTGLNPSTKYYYRAYAETGGWGHYGSIKSFTTREKEQE